MPFKSYDHTTYGPKIIFENELILLTTSIKIHKNHFLAYQVFWVNFDANDDQSWFK
jgi:hypothetical protein